MTVGVKEQISPPPISGRGTEEEETWRVVQVFWCQMGPLLKRKREREKCSIQYVMRFLRCGGKMYLPKCQFISKGKDVERKKVRASEVIAFLMLCCKYEFPTLRLLVNVPTNCIFKSKPCKLFWYLHVWYLRTCSPPLLFYSNSGKDGFSCNLLDIYGIWLMLYSRAKFGCLLHILCLIIYLCWCRSVSKMLWHFQWPGRVLIPRCLWDLDMHQ